MNMEKDELELLEALIDMCDQHLYCESSDDYDNHCMYAGELALRKLDDYGLLKNYSGRIGKLDRIKWQKMKEEI